MKRAFEEVYLQRLAENVQTVRSLIGPTTKIMGIVKADAYGHGAVEVADTILSQGVEYLGVACITEAMQLRQAGISAPILVLSEPVSNVVDDILNLDVTQTVYSLPFARMLSNAALSRNKKVNVHIKVDTGMSRIGVHPDDAVQLIASITHMEGINVEGLFTHFARADEPESGFTEVQFERFMQVVQALKNEKIPVPPLLHTANSAAIRSFPRTHLNMVRAGIMLYDDVLMFKAHVAHLKKVPAGTPISYGSTFVTEKVSEIATISVGYADGYDRALSNKGTVLIKGKRYPIVGRICMDMCMSDITGAEDVQVGDEVVLIGAQGAEQIKIDELSAQLGTITYEVMCGIGKRVPRIYK